MNKTVMQRTPDGQCAWCFAPLTGQNREWGGIVLHDGCWQTLAARAASAPAVAHVPEVVS